MQTVAMVAVEATEERFRVLKHQPSGIGFEEDGRSEWPADQFTFRLKDEGAIRLLQDLHDPGDGSTGAKREPEAQAPAEPAAPLPADPVPAPDRVEAPVATGRALRAVSPLKPQE